MSGEDICAVCQQPAQQKCSACKLVFYCSREHQKCHWKEHASYCRPFKIDRDDTLGRHYIATRKIEKGEVILRERTPLVAGPPVETPPVCLGCYGILQADNAKPCDKCGWPLCGACQGHGGECQFTTQFRDSKVSVTEFGCPHPTYRCINIVRALALRESDPKAYQRFLELQGQCPNDDDSLDCNRGEEHKALASFVKRFFKIDHIKSEEIIKIAGILQINGHEVPTTEPPHMAVYDGASYFEHSCHANSSKSFTEKGGLIIRAAVTINEGDHISMCYTDPLWGIANRRHYLLQTKFFHCQCTRCSDATEFGTMYNGLKCSRSNCCGTMLPPTFLVRDNEKCPDYFCNKCDETMTWQAVDAKLEQIGIELASMKKNDVNECMRFLNKYSKVLHENHFYMVDVKLAMSQMIGQQAGGLAAVSDEMLSEKISLCKKLDELFRILMPAENRLRGLVLFEVHAAIAEFGRRQGPDQLRGMLMLSRTALREAYELLRHEPDILPEGKIARIANKNLVEMDTIIKTLCQNAATPM
ncbi:SET domain-containing protein SmydA-8 [Diachasma alloeum]|uniref:SET domain-containing protein SmydA-8 n=1 Tax=Diachasma alloeum TaxID=454923 RepID=UPI000738255B|nr:SET domain-containing protein SmydA-8 [Diachasma alloeum]